MNNLLLNGEAIYFGISTLRSRGESIGLTMDHVMTAITKKLCVCYEPFRSSLALFNRSFSSSSNS